MQTCSSIGNTSHTNTDPGAKSEIHYPGVETRERKKVDPKNGEKKAVLRLPGSLCRNHHTQTRPQGDLVELGERKEEGVYPASGSPRGGTIIFCSFFTGDLIDGVDPKCAYHFPVHYVDCWNH